MPSSLPRTPAATATRSGRHDGWLSAAIALVLILASLLVTLRPRTGEPVLVITWPFGSARPLAAIIAADARLVDVTPVAWIAVAATTAPDQLSHLRRQPGVLVLAHPSPALCNALPRPLP